MGYWPVGAAPHVPRMPLALGSCAGADVVLGLCPPPGRSVMEVSLHGSLFSGVSGRVSLLCGCC